MTGKRYVSDVKNTEKEVRIFDLGDEKKIFNIFFNELDSAICLNGALGDVITRLNEQHETIQRLEEQLKNSYVNEICEVCKHGEYSVDWYGEGEFECLKRHFGVDYWKCDGLKECDDFELDDKVYLNE